MAHTQRPALDERWRLSPSVALRPESFGALAYHFGNRRLTFLKNPRLVALVQGLAEQPNIGAALAAAEVPQEQWPVYLQALAGLADGDMIQPLDRDPADEGDAV
ncbi:mycofactocin biosynthesis chaperone MftB [Flexivirga oryzae]|uniref:Putative mycofactocin binding protein MftB n=1 Tax=Flexivirga oryzae TaxID=1794944 RepID=A0A839NDG9_9MICO|nr:mycofactocin biosynthesis chaperone MftB [Flexivirga oryzae]MBB2892731.1 putative mycofactocin binding protein MftB [Flexivirga oryzae]